MTAADGSRSDEATLELLLTYAIPRRDVRTLAEQLIARFGSLSSVLSASAEELCRVDGIKLPTAALLKAVDWIRVHAQPELGALSTEETVIVTQPPLFDIEEAETPAMPPEEVRKPSERREVIQRPRTGLIGKAVLEEAVEQLPQLPDTESLEEIGRFLRTNLHFSAEETRHRYSNYIIRRMFPDGYADWPMRAFARRYAGRQQLRDVCFYRFCKAEPLMLDVAEEVLLPARSSGMLDRALLRDYLNQRFPDAKSVKDCSQAIVQAWAAAGLARANRQSVTFGLREIAVASFAFILHSEFTEPGMYDIGKVETNAAIRALLWNPERIVPALYDLRNMGILSKVSQIDAFRQFTTKGGLAETVRALVREDGNA
jgi:DNA repair protein RadC